MASVTYDQAERLYPGSERPAVQDFSLQIDDGEFIVLVGPSGCGKSTSLRMLAGLEEVTSGRVLIGDRDVTHVPPKDRDIAMVFQNYALYPHMSVAENMAFSLKMAKVSREEGMLGSRRLPGSSTSRSISTASPKPFPAASGSASRWGVRPLMTDSIPEQPSWVQNTDFPSNYFPGVILMALVGGSSLIAAIALIKRSDGGQLASIVAGAILVFLIIGDVAPIRGFHFLQVIYLVTGALVVMWTPGRYPGRVPFGNGVISKGPKR
jgi:hypothetical protein